MEMEKAAAYMTAFPLLEFPQYGARVALPQRSFLRIVL
jgi:hypothetical protein